MVTGGVIVYALTFAIIGGTSCTCRKIIGVATHGVAEFLPSGIRVKNAGAVISAASHHRTSFNGAARDGRTTSGRKCGPASIDCSRIHAGFGLSAPTIVDELGTRFHAYGGTGPLECGGSSRGELDGIPKTEGFRMGTGAVSRGDGP